ncbi:hypothetical protein GIB67_025902 [Kingdonia uniflora]|uniref:Uncharacterized protein n=1 Tax=Kingdonia uniflora TaxID=39325 RepID=A0A7J7NYZ8_9MAGN|nr:hypothetical protein GIB67_025902 [Kingdonia uniflora]
MSEQKNRWNWEVPGFEQRKSVEQDDSYSNKPVAAASALHRRYSISTTSLLQQSDSPKQVLINAKVHKLKEKLKRAKEDYLELKQEASDLQEYSNAKLDRVTRYLGFLADRARKLGKNLECGV